MLAMKNRFFSSLLDLIYPSTCLICESELSRFEKSICSICDENLLLTNFQHFNEPTELDQLFWGRTPLEFTYSHLFFRKNSSSQTILFSLKYKNNPDLGVYFGEQIGMAIEEKVKQIVAEQLGVDEDQVTEDASFIDDLGADSLDTVELVMAFEEEFKVEIPDDAAENIQTVGDAVKTIKVVKQSWLINFSL